MKKQIGIAMLLLTVVVLHGQEINWQAEVQALYNGADAPFYSGGLHYAKPELVDIDADGDLDLLVGTNNDTGVYFFRNDGTAAQPHWVMVKTCPRTEMVPVRAAPLLACTAKDTAPLPTPGGLVAPPVTVIQP